MCITGHRPRWGAGPAFKGMDLSWLPGHPGSAYHTLPEVQSSVERGPCWDQVRSGQAPCGSGAWKGRGRAQMHQGHLKIGVPGRDWEPWIGAFVHLCLATLNLNSCHL